MPHAQHGCANCTHGWQRSPYHARNQSPKPKATTADKLTIMRYGEQGRLWKATLDACRSRHGAPSVQEACKRPTPIFRQPQHPSTFSHPPPVPTPSQPRSSSPHCPPTTPHHLQRTSLPQQPPQTRTTAAAASRHAATGPGSTTSHSCSIPGPTPQPSCGYAACSRTNPHSVPTTSSFFSRCLKPRVLPPPHRAAQVAAPPAPARHRPRPRPSAPLLLLQRTRPLLPPACASAPTSLPRLA